MSRSGAMESPCVAVCQINRATGVCEGCHRTLQEIAAWRQFTDLQRRRIMDDLPNRKHEFK